MGYPPQQYPPQGQPQAIDNNMTMSIVSIFLFWPLAIPAIINASKVNPALQAGDYAGAQHFATVDALANTLAQLDRAGTTILVKGSRFMRMERIVARLCGESGGDAH